MTLEELQENLADEVVTTDMKVLQERATMAMLLGAEWSSFLGMFVKYADRPQTLSNTKNRYFDRYGVELNGQEAADTRYTSIRSEEKEGNARSGGDAA